ncbi:glycosyltransferase family 39 protein [Conyzicola nivalis]|uniref:Mannosyltransferase n=1 Tax=Conyzicola nivalis TaxID=1477021 RepID=A0A916WLW7_9MICO|nr:glycosyltransferase family 39 protein [Conyzicola nivalis]GGB14485.1 mannosyltransferase [Conyzicola nivalis]
MTATLETEPVVVDRIRGIRTNRFFAPALVGVLGLAISLAGIGEASIWYDESATIISATRSWEQLGAMIANVDLVHALYYAVMHVVFDVFGYSPLSLRVPSAIAIGVAAALTVVLGRILDSPRLGVLAGVVFCLLPRVTWAGTEGRSYATSAALAVLLTIVLVLASRSTGNRWWALYAALVVVSCLVFVYLALVVMAHAVTMAWWVASDRSRAWPPVARWARWTALGTAIIVPFGVAVMGQSGQVQWINPPGKNTFREVFENQWFYTSTAYAIVAWMLLAAGAFLLLRSGRGLSLASVLLPALVVPTVVLLLVSATSTPVFSPRYLMMSTPFVALLMAVTIERMRPRGLASVVLLVLAALVVPQFVAQRQPEAKEKTSWIAIADLIASQRALDGPDSTTAIVYGNLQRHPTATSRVIAYSYPDAFAGTIDVTLGTPAAQTGQLWETRIPLTEGLPRLADADVVYLITSESRDARPETTDTLRAAGWNVAEEWGIPLINVVRYERG